jgi:hypothetical protein
MNESTTAAQGFSNKAKLGFAAAAAIITGALVGAFHGLLSTLSESEKRVSKLVDTSTRLGVGIPELQGLQYAAQQSGIGIDSMNGALGKMLKNVGDAARAGDSATNAFSRLGLSASALAQMGVDQQYLAIANAINQIPTAAGQAAAAVAIFGKSGVEQLSLIKDGVQGALIEFKGLGIQLSTEQSKAVEAYGDSVTKLGSVWTGFENQLTAALAGPLKELLDWVVQTSINMGGLGPVATATASGILTGMQGVLLVIQSIKNSIDLVIVAFDAMGAAALQSVRIVSLGLADIFTNAAKTQAALEGDAMKRLRDIAGSAATLNAQTALSAAQSNLQAPQAAAQQPVKVDVTVSASNDFVAKVVGSNANKTTINTQAARLIQQAAAQER